MIDPSSRIHPSAIVDDGASIGAGTAIWHFSHICDGAIIGSNCSFGQNTLVSPGVTVGDQVKVQNNVALYTGTVIESDVFLGPSCVLTNVTNPRSQVSRKTLYERTLIRRGATIGANATVVCGITLGRYCFIAAGAVVARDVPDYGLILGIPGRLAGFMSRHGHKLSFDVQGMALCPESQFRYQKQGDQVRCLDLDEEAPLPAELASGERSYDDFKTTSAPSQ